MLVPQTLHLPDYQAIEYNNIFVYFRLLQPESQALNSKIVENHKYSTLISINKDSTAIKFIKTREDLWENKFIC